MKTVIVFLLAGLAYSVFILLLIVAAVAVRVFVQERRKKTREVTD